MNFHLTKHQLYSLLTVLGLFAALILGLTLVKQSQEIRKKASGVTATLAIYPTQEHFNINETKYFELKATFTDGSSSEKLDYFKTTVSFSSNYIIVPEGKYVDVSASGFDNVFRVDGPSVANGNNKIIIELGAKSKGSGPPTDKPITIAKIYFSGKAQTPSLQDITIGSTQAVNNQSAVIPVTVQDAKYEVGGSGPTPTGSATLTPTPTSGGPTPTGTQQADVVMSFNPSNETFNVSGTKVFELKASFNDRLKNGKLDYFKTIISFSNTYLQMPSGKYVDISQSGFDTVFRVDGPEAANNSGKIVIELGANTPDSGPSTSQPISLAKIYFSGKAKTPSAQNISIDSAQFVNNQSQSLTVDKHGASYTVSGTVVTPTPGGEDKYTIDVGAKDSLTINIGPSASPQVRFKVKLAHVQPANAPGSLYMRLRVKDDLAFMDSPPVTGNNPSDSCNTPPSGTLDFLVPMKANEDGVYMPVPQEATAGANAKIYKPAGVAGAIVSPDGWVDIGMDPDKYYSLFLKGPKTRKERMIQHVVLKEGRPQSQDFDWTDYPLSPGDLPDPNNGGRQDCTVNTVDISLIISRLACTSNASSQEDKCYNALTIADVNYDKVVNGNDISKVVNTLQTKPDDDN